MLIADAMPPAEGALLLSLFRTYEPLIGRGTMQRNAMKLALTICLLTLVVLLAGTNLATAPLALGHSKEGEEHNQCRAASIPTLFRREGLSRSARR